MQEFTHFVIQHWIQWLLLFILLGLILRLEFQGGNGVKRVSPQRLVMMMNREKAHALDLRSHDLYKTGHIIQSECVKDTLESAVKKIKKDAPVVLLCADGRQALQATKSLKKMGFTQVSLLEGGIAAWTKANLPLVKES